MDIIKILNDMLIEYKGEGIYADENSTFDQLGFDSLDKMELVMKIEEQLNITFPDDFSVSTVGELINLIKTLK